MIQLVAFDLDGTLMGADLVISPRVRDAIARTVQRGIVVTLATGRMYTATAPFARSLDLSAPLICYQGGWIQGLDTEVLHRITLPDALAREAIALGCAKGWHTILYADGQLFIDEQRLSLSYYETYLGPEPVEAPDLTSVLLTHQPDKVLFIAEPESIAAMAEQLVGHFGTSADVIQSHANFIEVVPRHVNKGQALAWLAGTLGIPQHAVLAAGDQQNDLSMIQWAGTGVAMGNAVPAVQAIADWIAPPMHADGAAAILERYVLTSCSESGERTA
ncbi:MAG: HAD family phosphatase [Anaerolineae bacterium]|nr:HAD family phosphatase [Anaerolineae bacterium]